jgi:hypothetical protein
MAAHDKAIGVSLRLTIRKFFVKCCIVLHVPAWLLLRNDNGQQVRISVAAVTGSVF